MSPTLVLAAAVLAGFTVEAAIGFGAMVVPLSVGSLVMPTSAILFRVVPLNLVLSAAILLRAPRAADVRTLVRRILPAMLVGLPIGLVALRLLPARDLQRVLAGFVLALVTIEILGMVRATPGTPRPLSGWASTSLLVLGGVAHGALAAGGPPVVYVCARILPDKTAFRATMSALWLLMNLLMVAVYVANGAVSPSTLRDSAPLVPALALGVVLGDVLHHRVPERLFKLVVFVGLLVVAAVLAVRA